MFNTDFLAGLLVLGLTFAGALALAALTGFDPTWTLIGLAGLIWGLFALWERRLTRRMDRPEASPIHVDWEDRLNETDFRADGDLTRLDLEQHGLTAETAVGRNFVFATEHEASGGDIWFEGRFTRDAGGVVIRAREPV